MAIPPNFPIFAKLPAGQNPLSLFDDAFAMILNGQAPVPIGEIDVGVTVVGGGGGNILYDNAGKLGALASTGAGSAVRQNAASIVNANLNTPSAINLTNATHLPLASIDGFAAGMAAFLAAPSSANLLATMTTGTGTGLNVFNNTPTLITPVLGAASATSLATSGDVNVGGNEAITGALTIGTPLGVAYGGTGASIGALAENLNLSISATISGGNQLNITLNGANGAALSATNPYYASFRNVTPATGTPSSLAVTASPTLAITNGSTMGVSGNNVPFSLWLVQFNDGGTYRLGLVNTLSGSSIMGLRPGIASSTAEGGAGGADSAQVIYTNAAVAAKAMSIVARLEWSAGLAAIGVWATAPTTIKLWQPGDPMPGDPAQPLVRNLVTSTVNASTALPYDDTIPQITEGAQFMTQAITPVSAANLLVIDALTNMQTNSGTGNGMTAALFQDATANALAAQSVDTAAGLGQNLYIKHTMVAATTLATTFRIRGGVNTASQYQFNGVVGTGRLMGGVMNSWLQIQELTT